MKQNKNSKGRRLAHTQLRSSDVKGIRVKEHDHAVISIKVSSLAAAKWLDGMEFKIEGHFPLGPSNFKIKCVNDPLVKADGGMMKSLLRDLHAKGVPILRRRFNEKEEWA